MPVTTRRMSNQGIVGGKGVMGIAEIHNGVTDKDLAIDVAADGDADADMAEPEPVGERKMFEYSSGGEFERQVIKALYRSDDDGDDAGGRDSAGEGDGGYHDSDTNKHAERHGRRHGHQRKPKPKPEESSSSSDEDEDPTAVKKKKTPPTPSESGHSDSEDTAEELEAAILDSLAEPGGEPAKPEPKPKLREPLSYDEMMRVKWRMRYKCAAMRGACDAEFELTNLDRLRCKECGGYAVYKLRTKRIVQFEAK